MTSISLFRSAGPRRGAIGIALAVACAACAAQGLGGGGGGQRGGGAAELQKRFAAADTNNDGKLSKAEAQAGMPFVYQHYDDIDKGKTGAITMRDIGAYFRDRAPARKASAP